MIEESGHAYFSPSEAAARLKVSPRRIYALAKAERVGSVRVGGRLLIEIDSVDSYANGGERVGRPFSPRRAWALILLASDEDPSGLDPVTRSKLRRMLRERDVWSMRARLSGRAQRRDVFAHPSDLQRIDREPGVVRTGPRFAADSGVRLVAPDAASEYYVDAQTAEWLTTKYRLSPNPEPNLILRVVPEEVRSWLPGPAAPRVAVALDLAEDRDARSREAARAILAR